MQVSHAKFFEGLSFCLILSIFVNVLTSCNNGNSQAVVVQETELKSTQRTATQQLTLVPETEVATATQTWTLTAEPSPTATATATETPTPTEVSLIEGNIFFDPQSEADFPMVVESPSPIDEPDKFAAWQDEYLKMIEEKLETYDGTYMSLGNGGIMYQQGFYIFGNNEWKVMASYQFPWTDDAGNEQKIINKTYVFKDLAGNKIPLTVTYPPTSSPFGVWDVDNGYKTPESKLRMYIRYEWEDVKSIYTDQFIDTFLSDRNKNTDFDIWYKVVSGLECSKEDIEIAIRMPIVFCVFGKY